MTVSAREAERIKKKLKKQHSSMVDVGRTTYYNYNRRQSEDEEDKASTNRRIINLKR